MGKDSKETKRHCLVSKHGRVRVSDDKKRFHHMKESWGNSINFFLSQSTGLLLVLFVLAYVTSYLLFGSFWYIIWRYDRSCLAEVDGFHTAFLFSIETQSTIGYGSKHVADGCRVGTVLLLIQNISGSLVDLVMMGLIFARLTMPDTRSCALRCSRRAVITERDGKKCFLIRVADLRKKTPLVGVLSRMYLIQDYTTAEGEKIPFHTTELSLSNVRRNWLHPQPFLSSSFDARTHLYLSEIL